MFYFFVFMLALMAILGIAALVADFDFSGEFDGEFFDEDEEI